MPDYLCLIIDRVSDYRRACKGFKINGVRYVRLVGTNGGVKNETIVFVSDKVADEVRKRIENGRDTTKELVPAKFEAYRALTCSGSIPVSFPNGVLVVPDCITHFKADIININDECDGEPIMEFESDADVELNESDGYGLMLPSLADRWSEELKLDYRIAGANTRFAYEKGMVYCFDFISFAEQVAGTYLVKDAWGDEVDIRNVELILTTSMVKLWDSYDSCAEYLRYSIDNRYTFSVTKTCPRELESSRDLNYQFLQSYELSDQEIDELIQPTIDEIHNIIHGDWAYTTLYTKGSYLNERNIASIEDDFIKALMIDHSLISDPFISSKIYQLIRNRINEAKVGVIKVHGNYSTISGDPYALCQSIFGLPVTGLLRAGEIYNKYWAERSITDVVCFRAPMTCHNNIIKFRIASSPEIDFWYQYMNTATLFNCWDTACHALNGCDKDGDIVLLTDNPVLLRNTRDLPAIMCIQRKAEKKVVTESDLIESNIQSFGDMIGATTNRITSMFELLANFHEESREAEALRYRIKCGQLYQQNCIDKAKGILCKPMPRSWYHFNENKILDDDDAATRDTKRFYQTIVADRKPYFQIYIYPALMRQYKTYIKNINKKAQRLFLKSIDDLISTNFSELSPEEQEFLKWYRIKMPVSDGNCVVNRICRRFEDEFDNLLPSLRATTTFDPDMLKSDESYTEYMYRRVEKVYHAYMAYLEAFKIKADTERIDPFESAAQRADLLYTFEAEVAGICPNQQVLCSIAVDLCYTTSKSKQFVWDFCGEAIVENLLNRNNRLIEYPTLDSEGSIIYHGQRFSIDSKKI